MKHESTLACFIGVSSFDRHIPREDPVSRAGRVHVASCWGGGRRAAACCLWRGWASHIPSSAGHHMRLKSQRCRCRTGPRTASGREGGPPRDAFGRQGWAPRSWLGKREAGTGREEGASTRCPPWGEREREERRFGLVRWRGREKDG